MAVELSGARTLLTGATGGIGRVIARRLAAEGADLTLTGRRSDVLDELAAELGARAIRADLAESADVERLIAASGEIDVLVACAGLPGSGRFTTLRQTDVDRALAVNLHAPLALAHAFAPAMVSRRYGHLLFIGSLSARAASFGASVYCASKFGLRGFALSLRAELAGSGVGVSIVQPGFVSDVGLYADTAISLPPGAGTRPPEDVADAVVRAIERNRGEVTVAAFTLAAGAQIAGVAPGFAAWANRLLGGERIALQFEERQADKR
ncbi:MAG: SDR family NAD(P)-dependent oxidoreductase [Solirubrobacteraceae bacterium]